MLTASTMVGSNWSYRQSRALNRVAHVYRYLRESRIDRCFLKRFSQFFTGNC